ncbi:Glycoside hydrolase [Macleaya cordata]|uniref:Glycoside hydrolase n=1 Tax=Macleaya cordata TaxID=56857 RepID=A0A200QKK1_MACCD|nr:Glycoside hydrolase [Macleaya cordata]
MGITSAPIIMKTRVCLWVLLMIITTNLFNSSSSTILSSASATDDELVYNVVKLGAKPDGKTDSTKSFLNAWNSACNSAVSSAIIYVPRGMFVLSQVIFTGQCKNTHITFQIDGTLLAPRDYHVLGNAEKWIAFDDVAGVSIKGGIIDGRGMPLWSCKLAGQKKCPDGATSLLFRNSKDIKISGFTSINSQMFNIVINGCQNVHVEDVKVKSAGNSPNTDGIHVQSSTNIAIIGANIKTGDDCISIGPGTSNLWIEHIACGPGHGISIGSLGKGFDEPGVQNVTVKTVTFSNTENGLRIKTWGRPSDGFVRGVRFEGATMNYVYNPIIIDQNYCPHNEDCPDQVSGVKISDVSYKDIQGTSATRVAVNFDCSSKNPCRDITVESVKLTYRNQPAVSSCINADGSAYGFVEPASCFNKN